jgi:hypothetical protein
VLAQNLQSDRQFRSIGIPKRCPSAREGEFRVFDADFGSVTRAERNPMRGR